MTLDVQAQPVPIRRSDDGALRIGDTRVTLHTVMSVFQQGYTPEDIVRSFPTLKLADVYAVIAYCLGHPEEVARYMAEYEVEANTLRKEVEASFDQKGFRERLLSRC
ncbi:MAG TPA: DUF433 domain-containing protein [Tepidisphaeraceae bacterium]|jgi:uncharacterized protein (DUF433 family)